MLIKAAPVALRTQLCKVASAVKEVDAWNSQIQRFMDCVVRTVVDRNFVALRGWAEKALSLPVNKTVLRVTGVGLLMGDASLWAMAPRPPSGQTAGEIANTVVARWRERIAAQPLDTELKEAFKHVPDGARPLGGLRTGAFVEAVARLREHAVASDPQVKDEVATKAAFAVALMGITRPEELTNLSSDCPAFSHRVGHSGADHGECHCARSSSVAQAP
mgnify:CR=1 FL=1